MAPGLRHTRRPRRLEASPRARAASGEPSRAHVRSSPASPVGERRTHRPRTCTLRAAHDQRHGAQGASGRTCPSRTEPGGGSRLAQGCPARSSRRAPAAATGTPRLEHSPGRPCPRRHRFHVKRRGSSAGNRVADPSGSGASPPRSGPRRRRGRDRRRAAWGTPECPSTRHRGPPSVPGKATARQRCTTRGPESASRSRGWASPTARESRRPHGPCPGDALAPEVQRGAEVAEGQAPPGRTGEGGPIVVSGRCPWGWPGCRRQG
jgi:hypothetical protein